MEASAAAEGKARALASLHSLSNWPFLPLLLALLLLFSAPLLSTSLAVTVEDEAEAAFVAPAAAAAYRSAVDVSHCP